jgi:hypothetical protein
MRSASAGDFGAPSGVSWGSWDGLFSLVNAGPERNTPVLASLAHLVCIGLGFPYI